MEKLSQLSNAQNKVEEKQLMDAEFAPKNNNEFNFNSENPAKPSFGLNFNTFPNMYQRSILEYSVKSNNCSLNYPPLSINSEKNPLNFYEFFCKQNKINNQNKCPLLNSNFEYLVPDTDVTEAKKNKKLNRSNSKKNQSINPSYINPSKEKQNASIADASYIGKENPFTFIKEDSKNPTQNQNQPINPFLMNKKLHPKSVEPDDNDLLQKRDFDMFSSKNKNNANKHKRNSLIVPKQDRFLLADLARSESKSQTKIQAQHLLCEDRFFFNWQFIHPRHTYPVINLPSSKHANSTIPDLTEEVRQAVDVMKKINVLNKSINCNEEFREKLTELIDLYEKNKFS